MRNQKCGPFIRAVVAVVHLNISKKEYEMLVFLQFFKYMSTYISTTKIVSRVHCTIRKPGLRNLVNVSMHSRTNVRKAKTLMRLVQTLAKVPTG